MAARPKIDPDHELAELQRAAAHKLERMLIGWGRWVRINNRMPGCNDEGWPAANLLHRLMKREHVSGCADWSVEERVDRAVRVQMLLNPDPRPAAALFACYAYVVEAENAKQREMHRAATMKRLVAQTGHRKACGRVEYQRALSTGREYVRGYMLVG